MTDNYKEFDERFRAMLENAEEEVPPQLSDNVFAKLDAIYAAEGRRRALPLWLRRVSAISAIAAAVLLAVVLWPDDNKEMLVAEDIEVDEDRSVEALAEVLDTNQDNVPEEMIPVQKQVIAKVVVPQEIESRDEMAGENSGAEEIIDDEIAEGSETVTENESGADDGTVIASEDGSEDESSYIDWNEPKERRKAGKAAIVLGGDLSSNGNAKSLGRFSGLRAPAAGIRDRTWIEQTDRDSQYAIPISVGIGARYQFAGRWSVGAGVNYTMLSRTFAGVFTRIENGLLLDRISTDIRHNIHYIGIPVNFYYDILNSRRVKFYAYGGGAVEFPVSNSYRVKNSQNDIIMKEKVKGVQYSVGAGIGVEFMLANHLGLYLDPGFRYYFDNGQPVSIRTQQPFMMNFELGFRFDI